MKCIHEKNTFSIVFPLFGICGRNVPVFSIDGAWGGTGVAFTVPCYPELYLRSADAGGVREGIYDGSKGRTGSL